MHVSTTDPDLATIADRYFAEWRKRDADAIVALHTADTQFWIHLGTEPVHGRDAVRDTIATLFEQFPNFGFTVHRVVFADGHWALDWTATFDAPDGEKHGFDCLDLVEVTSEGLVARKDTFIDFIQMQEQTK